LFTSIVGGLAAFGGLYGAGKMAPDYQLETVDGL